MKKAGGPQSEKMKMEAEVMEEVRCYAAGSDDGRQNHIPRYAAASGNWKQMGEVSFLS